jgi:alpha-tubulin suppressor-like RCC1 family protein
LSNALPANVATPTLIEGLTDFTIVAAALGKGHTLVLTNAGTVMAVGSNKVGQCGINSTTDSVSQFKPCVFPADVKIAQVSTYLVVLIIVVAFIVLA